MKEDGTLIDPDKSARKCALLIIQELYDSGDHIDYYDQIEGVDYHRKVTWRDWAISSCETVLAAIRCPLSACCILSVTSSPTI